MKVKVGKYLYTNQCSLFPIFPFS